MKARVMGKVVEIPDRMVRQDGSSEAPAMERKRPDQQSRDAASLPGWPNPKDKWNYAYAQFVELEKHAGRIKHWWFEGFSIYLPGKVKYTPDFLIQYPDGLERPLHFVEVKGWSRNLRDGITRYKIAASMFPCFTWSMVKRERGGWVDY